MSSTPSCPRCKGLSDAIEAALALAELPVPATREDSYSRALRESHEFVLNKARRGLLDDGSTRPDLRLVKS